MQYKFNDQQVDIPTNHSLLLNCIESGKQIENTNSNGDGGIVIVTFHPDVLKKIYDKELPALLQRQPGRVSNQSGEQIGNEFLIRKYIEGLLLYFENPALVNEDILILKLKEIILLLSQTRNAATIQVILSQLFFTCNLYVQANSRSKLICTGQYRRSRA